MPPQDSPFMPLTNSGADRASDTTLKTTRRILSRRCAQLLDFNQELFDLGYVEAAYHALEASIHCAIDLQDLGFLRRASERAAQQHRQMERRRLPYLHEDVITPTAPALVAAEATRWTSMERLFAAAERQASSRVTTLEREQTRL